MRDFAKGENFEGEKPTVPLRHRKLIIHTAPVKTCSELLGRIRKPRRTPRFVAFAQAMDMMGITVNTYKKKERAEKPDLDLGKFLESTAAKD